ncbi:NADP-dependent oxidoreductase [Glutamicibacter sp. PS]|uniref:NADP-dependent oxidoreductase n=1 Tax=Glutamicibacter sp. PS TaxID=3075634 RepID=UPI002841B5C0|nr:NADP-dependent oxidoreductase [Glutamicibacter sp. PS]MDR4532699.1 NADP-dependent oxidoreductase [Glutamicibacter sp. PS]
MNSTVMMKVATQEVVGEPEVLRIAEVPRPTPRPNEILVRVHAAGINPTDWKHRAGAGFLGEPPYVLGWDVSGVVEEVGIGVARFQPGDEVFGMMSYPFGHGTHAEYVSAPARVFAAKPTTLDHIHAAALPLVSLTAWQALVDYAQLEAGQRVLIHAAAGGVGHVAVQIAKARGAYVIGTASAAKHEFLHSLGVDRAIDYRSVDVTAEVRDVDVVLDTIGAETSVRSLQTLRRGGVLVSTLPIGSDDLYREAQRLGVRAVRMLVDSSKDDLATIAEMADAGSLRPAIAETFPLDRIAQAHRAGESGHTAGKLVITMA